MLCFYITRYSHAQTVYSEDFEKKQHNWVPINSSILFEISTDEYKEGSQSARIQNNSTSTYGVEYVLPNISNEKYYDISGYIKTIDPPPAKAFVRIAWYESTDGTGTQIKTEDSPIISQETDWTLLTFNAESPEHAQSAKIRLLVSSGSAYFDSVHMAQVLAPTIKPTISPTPTFPLKPTNAVSIQHIAISEAMVYPESGQQEWIELYNGNTYEVTLEDWFIDDIADGGATLKQFSITIPAHGLASYEISSALFNNAGDSIRLLNPSREEVDKVSYSESKKGYSIGRSSNNFICIQEPSQNKINNRCIDSFEEKDSEVPTTVPTKASVVKGIATTLSPTLPITPISKNSFWFNQSEAHTPQDVQDNEILTISEDTDTSSKTNTKPWLLLSGSYSTLAVISLVSKLVFLRYT